MLITGRNLSILGMFAKFRKATISLVTSVHPSIHPQWNNSTPAGQIFFKFDIYLTSCVITVAIYWS